LNKRDICELRKFADETYEFRLLTISCNQIEIAGVKIMVHDLVFAFIQNDAGISSDCPFVKIEMHVGPESIKAELSPTQSIKLRGWNLTFRYALDGEYPGLPTQSAAYFRLQK
jgi:hypothetical protein